MAIRIYKRTSAGRRNASVNMHVEVTKTTPEKSLLTSKKRSSGRNHHGFITVRSRGGGAKKQYRKIDFKRNMLDAPAKVVGIEYDPNRTCHIALLEYADGQKRYILAPLGLKVGEELVSSDKPVEPKAGNAMPLALIPAGLSVHNVEMVAGEGGKLCRSAGMYARLTNKEGQWATLVFPSGEIRQVSMRCRATIGQVGNLDHQNVRIGKAGRSRHMGWKPHVRGKAMNPIDHPMGGGEGRSNGGRHPCSPWGQLAKGGRTRSPRKNSTKRILRRRWSRRYGLVSLKGRSG